jgi:hypothetical protein
LDKPELNIMGGAFGKDKKQAQAQMQQNKPAPRACTEK